MRGKDEEARLLGHYFYARSVTASQAKPVLSELTLKILHATFQECNRDYRKISSAFCQV
jgi:hypothetical protein